MSGKKLYTARRPMLACQRSEFSLPHGVHYLNCAFMAPLAKKVRVAGIDGIDRRAAPHLIGPEHFFEESDLVRCLFSRLINTPDPNRVAIIPSVSYGLATVANNIPTERGDNIVVMEEQFPSNVYVWRRLCAERGLELRTVHAPPAGESGRAFGWNTRLLTEIDRRTAVVALPHVHWADGTMFDLERIGERARDCHARLVVDGTQSVGAMPFDVQRVQPDALVCAGYKWLLGPYSVGLAYYGRTFDHGAPLEENWITRRDSEAFAQLVHYREEYQPAAIRYDVGERSNFTLLPMLAAALELVLAWTVPAIQDYCRRLCREVTGAIRERGHWVEEERWRGNHLFGIRTRPDLDAATLERRLHDRQVAVSFRGNAIRVAPHLYNDANDTSALLDALE
ncbi:MAG: aminotransferase class V-fold PLP-dependent enzyme [Acidobacteriota bacterium]|nr:aminotransferase class V-fold PLP-dependent enzyme [Acidobacteriota bacterium]